MTLDPNNQQPIPDNLQQSLKEYIETWNTGKYTSLSEVDELFPEFNNLSPQQKSALPEYIETWNTGKYKTVEDINQLFPELFPVKKKVGAEPSGVSQSPFNGKGAALLPTTKSQGIPLLTKEDDTTPNFLPEAVVDFEKYTKGLPKGSKKPSPADVKKSQEYGMRFGIIPSMQDNPEFQSIGIVKEAGVVEKQYPKIEPAPPKEKIKDLAEPAALLASAINNTKKIDAKAQWEKITPTAQIEYDGYVQQGGTLPIQEYAKERIVELETTDFVGNEIKLRQTPVEVYEQPEGTPLNTAPTPSNTAQLTFKALDPNYPQRPAGDIGMYVLDVVNELKRKDEHSYLILDNTLKRINSGEVKWDVPGVTMPPEFVGAMKDLKVRTQNRMQVDMSILSKSLTDFRKKYKDHKPLMDSIQAKVADIDHYTSIVNAASVEGATPEQIAEAQRIEPLYKKAHGEYQKLMTTYTTLFDKKSVEKYNSDLAAYKQLQQKYNSLPYYFSKYDKEYQNVTNLIGDFNTATGAKDVVVDVIYSSLDQLANALKSTTNFITQAPYRAGAFLTDIEFLDNLVLSFDANTKYKNIHQVSSGFFQDQVGYLPMKELSIEQKKDLARYNPGVDIEKLKPSDFVKTPLDKWKPVNFVATIAATIGEMYLLPNKMSSAVSTMTGASRATAMTSLMYMRSYEDNYSRMLNTEGLSDGERVWLAATLSAMEGLSEQIMPDYKLFDKGSLAKNLVMAYSRGGKAEALRAGSKILLQTAEENLEEQAVLFGTAGLEAITNSLKGREIFEPQDLMGEAVNTALITSAVMGVLGVFGGGIYRAGKQFFDPANMDAQNLVYLSHDSQFKELPQILNELELGGEITAEKRNEITTMVANIREIKSKLPESLSENFTAIKLMAERNELLSQLKPVDKADFMDVNKDLNHEISLVEKELERMSALAEYQYRNIKEVNYFTEKENGKNVYFKQESDKEKEKITQKEFRDDIARLKSFGATLTNKGGLVTFEEVRDKINVYRSETTEALRKKIEEIRYGTVAEGKGKKRGKNKVIPLKLSEARRRQLLSEVIDKLNPEFRQRATPIVETALRELEAGNVSADSIKRLTKSLAQSQQFANMDEVRYNQSTQSFEGIKAGTVVRSIALNDISGNTEWINPFAMQEDTLVHELAAHPYVSTMAMEAGTKDGKLFNFADEAQRDSEYERLMSANLNDLNPQAQILRKGFALIHNTEYISRVQSAGYSGKFGLYEEALVQAIGDYGAAMDTEEKRQSFLDIIKDLIKWLGGKAFKNRGLNPREFRKMDIKTYLAAVTSDITTTPGVAPAKLEIRKGRMNFQVGKLSSSESFFNDADKIFPNDHILGGYAVTNSDGKLIGRIKLSKVNDNTVKIDEVVSEKRGQRTGNGSTIMKMTVENADKNNVTLTLIPNNILSIKAKGFETPQKLQLFYEKFGFIKDKGKASMTRLPDSVEAPKAENQNKNISLQNETGAKQPVAGNRLFNRPIEAAKKIADRYFKAAFGTERTNFEGTRKLDKERAKRIADAYADMKNDPDNPEVKAAYEAMVKETVDQYKEIIKDGYFIEVNNEEAYANSEEMIEDLRNNKRMKIFSTEAGYGDSPITEQQRKENPLLKDSGFKDKNGVPLLNNDIFRAVHDFFGHAELGNSFGALGEENAWNVHSRMYSPLARKAVTTETRGQNSYVNFSGVNAEAQKLLDEAAKLRSEGKLEEALKITESIYEKLKFADQKIGLLPEEFTTYDDEVQVEKTPAPAKAEAPKFQISGTQYTFTGEEKDFEGITVRRIKYGDTVGGWIEFEDNIQGGKVLGDAVVIGDAMVMDDAVVAGKAVIDGTEGRVVVAGTSVVSGDVSITGTVDIDGETMITGHVSINADNLFIKSSTISGNVSIDLQGLANLDGEYIVGTYGINDLADITQETTEAQSFIGGIHNRLRGVWSNVQGFVNRSAEDISSEDIQNISLKSLIERLPITEDDKKIIEDSTKSAMVTGEYKILEDETIIDRINHKVRNIDIIPKNGDIDRQIDALTKSLESMPQNKLKDLVRLRLSDLHATKFLREKWVNEMQSRPGFESTVKDLAIVSDVNDYGTMTRYLVDAEGNSYGNMSVSAHGFVITAAIKRAYHGDTELGSKNKLAEALYRGITNGMIATTGARLKSDGTFQATEYINPKTGLKEERFRAKDFWEKLIKYGYAEIDERGNYVALFQIIGEQGAQYLPKISNDLNIAQAMERDLGLEIDYWDVPDKEQLKKMYKIRLATGWERGKDGLWRYELDPIKLKFSTKEGLKKVLEGKPVMSEGAIRVPLSEIIDTKPFGQHYNLDDVFVYFDPYENTYNAHYANNAIGVSLALRSIDSGVTVLKSVLSHEIQHHIQKKEGFSMGGGISVGFTLRRDIEDTKDKIRELKSIKEIVNEKDIPNYDLQISELETKLNDFVKLYKQITDEDEDKLYFKSYEEVEARNVQNRIGMTKGERIATLLRHTEDVAPEHQILIPEVTYEKSLTEGSENMVVIMSKILGRGLDELSDTDIKSRYEEFMSEIEEAEGYTPTTRALRAMEDDIIDDAVKFQLIYHSGDGVLTEWDESKFKGGSRASHGWGMYFSRSQYKAEDYGKIKAVFDDADFNIFDLDKKVTEETIKDLAIRIGGEEAWEKRRDYINFNTGNTLYDVILEKLLDAKGTDFDTARKIVLNKFKWDANKRYAEMLVAAGYDAVSEDNGYYFVIINGQKYNEVYNKYKELGEMPGGVKFQMTSPITPDVTNKVLNQLDKEGYPIKSFSRKIVVYNSTDIYIDDKGSMGDLYSDVIFPIFKTRTEALRFLNRAGINLSVPAEVKFAIQPTIPTNEIRQVVKEGMDMMYTPELIRNEIIKIYNLKRKADIEALDVVMDEVYHDKTGKYMVLKNRRSARKAIKNNRGDMYVAETIHDIAERWNQMSDIDKEVVRTNASITPGDLASKAFKMVELRLDGKEETEEYLTLYEEMKNAGTQIGKALNIFKLFSVGAQSKEKTLNDRFKLYGKKLPDNVEAEFKKLFTDIEDLTREIKMGAGVLSPIDILIKEADLEKLTRRQDLLWAQYNPEQTSMLRLFDAGKGNLFKIVTMGVNLVSNVVSNITNIAIFTPVSLIRGKAGHVLTKSDLVFGVRKGLPLTLTNIVENYKYGTYSSTSESKVGGFGSHQMLRYFNPYFEAVGATFETYILGTPVEEVAEDYKMLLTKTKSGDLRITKRDIAKKIWMGTVGANSDIMLRTLVTGDAPFTNTVYLANLKRLARKEGITDEKKINDFITNAPHWAHEVALELAKTATFTQENPATEWIGKFKKSLLNTAETSTNPAKQFGAGAAYITTGVILPFTHVPLNFVYALTKMMAPTVYFADMAVIAGRIKQYDTSIEKEMGKTNPDRNRIEHWNKKKREEKNKLINKSYEMGAVIGVHFVFKLLAMSGAFAATGGDDDKEFKKKQLDKGEVNTVNFGIFLRWINHDRTKIWVPKSEPTDFKVNISKLGLLGIVPTVFANNYHKQAVKLRARGQEYQPTLDNTLFDIDSMLEMLTNITPALQESLQLTFVQSISKIFGALSAEGESGAQKAANVTTDLVNTVVTQVMFPNNAVGMFQANRDYIPASNKRFGLEAYPMMERFENLLKNKVNIKGQTIMDEFGNDIPQTPKNFVWGDGLLARWMYHNVSITKITRVGDEKNLAIGMYQKLDDYMLKATDNGIATEPFPITLKDANGISHSMTPEQYQKYCKEMGKIKELLVQNVFNTPGINKLLTLADIELKANVQELEDKNLDPKRKAELLSQMKTEIDMGIITKDGKATTFYKQLTSLTTGVQDEVRHERVRNIINDVLWKNYKNINKLYDNYFVHTEMKEQVSEISPEVRNRFINADEFNLIDSPEIQTTMKTAIETIQLELTDKLNKLTPLTEVDVNN